MSHLSEEEKLKKKKLEKMSRKPPPEEGLMKMSFAMAAHEGSMRCLCIASSSSSSSESLKKSIENSLQPGMLVSGGFDEALRVFDLKKHAEAGETKTPQDLGTPTCASFAPPNDPNPSHCLVGLTSGKILLYKKKDWSIAHVLGGGHSSDNYTTGEGVACLAVHPTGKMALSAGVCDGKICLWDLMKGRLAYVHKVKFVSKTSSRKERINSVVWSHDGSRYAFCHGTKLTARDAITGEDLLDIHLPSRVNQVCFLKGGEQNALYYVACACDDGSLPVLAVGAVEKKSDENENEKSLKQDVIRAVMAIEPVEKNLAGEDRIKCIQSLNDGYLVVTANSTGIISIMDLSGAVQMIMEESESSGKADKSDDDGKPQKNENGQDSDDESDDDSDDELLAVEILDSVRVGTGARITNIACWSSADSDQPVENEQEQEQDEEQQVSDESELEEEIDIATQSNESEEDDDKEEAEGSSNKRKRFTVNINGREKIEMDEEAVAKARELVKQAKKRQKRKEKKKSKKS